MKNLWNLSIACLKRAIFSKRFIVATLLVAVFEILNIFPLFYDGIIQGEDGIRNSYNLVELIRFSGVTMFLGFAFSVSILPYSGAFCDDKETSVLQSIVSRSSSSKYTFATTVACGISSFLCVFIGEILYLCFYGLFVDVCSQNTLENLSSFPSIKNGHYYLFIAGIVILRSFRGAFFALMSLLVSSFVTNRLVILSIPHILYFFFITFAYKILHLPYYLNVFAVYFNHLFGDDKELESIMYTAGFTIAIGIVTGCILGRRVRRCW